MAVMQDECRTVAEIGMVDAVDGEEDNAFSKPAVTDIPVDEPTGTPELTFEERLAALEETVTRHPLNREVLYRMLSYCSEERTLSDLEEKTAS